MHLVIKLSAFYRYMRRTHARRRSDDNAATVSAVSAASVGGALPRGQLPRCGVSRRGFLRLHLLIGLLPLYNNVNAGDRCSSPHRRLFALFHAPPSRVRSLPAPRLALDDVTFAIDLFAAGGKNTLSFAVAASDAGVKKAPGGVFQFAVDNTLSFAVAASDAGVKKAPGGVFQFAVDVSDRNAVAGPGKHWSVRWTAVRTGHGVAPAAAIVMMDAKVPASRAGALSCGVRGEAWATVALPAPGCGGGKLEAEVVVEVSGEDRLVEKVRIGVLLDCRYVSVDAGLRYLQHFLL
ncbi:hypothetical protein TRIUR3_25528 [Triticum urartu]|uniref:Uncharacterized protein n=4 Tax=Triticum TaxID=4564 RepID=M7ZGX2_TRIUA|nr:hypothetical protein TRIUR3_25528 [Triticum urartu]